MALRILMVRTMPAGPGLARYSYVRFQSETDEQAQRAGCYWNLWLTGCAWPVAAESVGATASHLGHICIPKNQPPQTQNIEAQLIKLVCIRVGGMQPRLVDLAQRVESLEREASDRALQARAQVDLREALADCGYDDTPSVRNSLGDVRYAGFLDLR